MAVSYLSFLGVAFTILTISYLITKKHKAILSGKFSWPTSRVRQCVTPPRSLSPTTKRITSVDALPNGREYRDTFPPCRRSSLANIVSDGFQVNGQSGKVLSELPRDEKRTLSHLCDSFALGNEILSTPTGFTIEEINALGDFPDYAMLSGVPLPQPYDIFEIDTAMPRPYRPFRWAYHQTMSYKKMEPDWWLELDKNYVNRINQRKALYAEHEEKVLQALPGTEIACKELMEMCLEFVCARYPHYFYLDKKRMILHNNILKTESHLKAMEPLKVLLKNVPEDFAIMLRNPETGYYNFRAGFICSSLGWSLASKIDLDLKDIHKPIPDYKEKMEFSMDRYFAKMPTEKPIQRGSWGLEIDEPLFMPPGHPDEEHRLKQDPNHEISQCNLRVDWQTLRRLPLSGAIVFNFKALFTPVTEFRDEPCIPSLLLKVLREGKKNLMEYKGTWHTEHVVIPALEQYEREQKESGMMKENWEPRTLDEYPYYSKWEEKWHKQQGF